ncbi:MAG: hypothetical protein RIT28_1163, partial [Pseudomonadota bacterium]
MPQRLHLPACDAAFTPSSRLGLGVGLALGLGLLSAGCGQRDEDGDGFARFEDCDDDKPNAWMSRSVFEGTLTPENAQDLCSGYCKVKVEGDLLIEADNTTQLLALACVSEVTGDV